MGGGGSEVRVGSFLIIGTESRRLTRVFPLGKETFSSFFKSLNSDYLRLDVGVRKPMRARVNLKLIWLRPQFDR